VGRKIVIESRSLSNPRLKRTVVETSDEDEAFYRSVREILRELPEGEDVIILTLKAHLVIEQLLIQMMDVAAVNAEPLKDLNRLQFSTRLALARSLFRPVARNNDGLWALVKKLGKIRNDIAHQLKPKKVDEEIETFIDMFIRAFGARVVPPVHEVHRDIVTKDNFLISSQLRRGSMYDKYRHALAGTAQGLAGALSVLREDAAIAWAAVEKERARRNAPPKRRTAKAKRT
jgi:hypothetical protein